MTDAPIPAAAHEGDRGHLDRAIALGWAGMQARDGGPFGCVIAMGDRVVAEGWNRVTSTLDPTAHAEIVALRRATSVTGHFELPGATVYASGEPCPMCWAACRWARVERIVYANDRGMAAEIGFDDQFLYDQLAAPPEQHDVPLVHVPLDRGRDLYEAWAADPSHVRY